MSQEIFTVAASALGRERRMEVLANNLSNINTLGFKQDLTTFQAAEAGPKPAAPNDSFMMPGPVGGVRGTAVGTRTDFTQGTLALTGNRLDLALDGPGFFCIQTEDAVQYSRRGNFSLNAEGTLVTDQGMPVLGEGGEIRIQGQYVEVGTDGSISVDGSIVDTLRVVDFPDSGLLQKQGDSLFAPIDENASPETAETVKVRQGYVEQSNVDPLRAMAEMIEVLRGYEAYQKVIQSVDEVNRKAVGEVGAVS